MIEKLYADAYQASVQKVIANRQAIGAAFPQVVLEETGLYNRCLLYTSFPVFTVIMYLPDLQHFY